MLAMLIPAALGLGLIAFLLAYRLLTKLGSAAVGSLVSVVPKLGASKDRQWANGLVDLLGKLAPLDRHTEEELDASLALSGSSWTPAQVRAAQVAGLAIGASLGALLAGRSHVALVALCAGGLVGFAAPRLAMILARRSWHKELSKGLPDMLDLLSVAVSSGTTLDDGLRIVADSMDGPLTEACGQVARRAHQEPVAKGFERFAQSTGLSDLSQVGHAIAHATESGAATNKVLLEQAKRLRNMRKLQVDEDSAKLDNQITVVCGLLVMPAAFASALLPYVWSIVQQFGTFG